MCFIISAVEAEWVGHQLGTSTKKFAKGFLKSANKWLIGRMQHGDSQVIGRFYKNNKFAFSTLKGKWLGITTGDIEVLKNPAAGVTVDWVSGEAGNSPPAGAVVGGEQTDGSPLYVIKSGDIPGYYDPVKGCARTFRVRPTCSSEFFYLTFTSPGRFVSYLYFHKIRHVQMR